MLYSTIRYDNEWVVRYWVRVFVVYSVSYSLLVSLQHFITTSPTHVASVTGRMRVCVLVCSASMRLCGTLLCFCVVCRTVEDPCEGQVKLLCNAQYHS